MRCTRSGLAVLLGLLTACGPELDDDAIQMLTWPVKAQCSITVVGKGVKDLEGDYLPHVVACENGAAGMEALKVQAVSARTFAYYKIASAGSVKDGTSDQVYSCGNKPSQKHHDAVKATSGQVLMWSSVVICAFYVAGAKPSTQSCVALSSDPDPTSTEKFVTYNAGKSGSGIKQTTLGWVNPSNKFNRGCMSQNGSHCQSLKGKKYPDILRFYYGDDIKLETAIGSCVIPPPPKPDAAPPPGKLDQGAASPDSSSRADGGPDPVLPEAGGPGQPELGVEPPERQASGCALGGAVPATGPISLLLLVALLGLARRRDRR